ncbi:putative reverse transcriptase domain-containing protein [Tanacetum coccineum]
MGDEVEQEEVGGNGNGGNGDGGNGNGGNRDGGNGNGGNGNGGNGNGGNGNGGNGNGGNGNGNGNGGEYGYNFRGFMPAREYTYQDFLKCQPLNFNGTKGVVGLTRCALTWWNSHKRTIGNEAAYAMSWAELMKLMTEVYCLLRNEDLEMKLNCESGLCCEECGGDESKRQMELNSRITWTTTPFKRQNISGQNVVRAYTTGNNERRGYTGPHPLCNKCKYHHVWPCTVKCNICKNVGHTGLGIVYLAQVTSKKSEDKSKERQLEDVSIIWEFPKVQFLGHVIDSEGIHVDPAKIESIKDWAPMTKLTQKSVKFDWGEKAEAAFQLLKQKLCSAPILALPEGSENFVVYCDASHKG